MFLKHLHFYYFIQAYMWTGSGQNEFQNLLNSLRRNKIKKELMNKITAAVQNATLSSNQQ